MKNRVEVMHGVNLDMLDRRPSEHYGRLSFTELEVRYFQSDFEGEYVQELHKASDFSDGLILNPGAWTHYSWAIRDALELVELPAVEVHLSDVDAREEWRRVSVISDLCVGRVTGRGPDGYREALEILKRVLAE